MPPTSRESSRLRQALTADGERGDRDVAATGVEAGPVPAVRPGAEEVPAQLLHAVVVHEDDRTVPPLRAPLDRGAVPVDQLVGVRHPPAQHDVGVTDAPPQLADRRAVTALAVL